MNSEGDINLQKSPLKHRTIVLIKAIKQNVPSRIHSLARTRKI